MVVAGAARPQELNMDTSTQSKHTPGPCGDRHEIDRAYSEAHERIRNAAPDLLAACEAGLREWSLHEKADENAARLCDMLRAAIAKARGGVA